MTHSGNKSLVYFGNERLVSGLKHTDAPILQGLIADGYQVKAVVTHHSETRSRKPRPLEVVEIATKHDIPVFMPDKPAEIAETLREINADAGILAAYGRIIPQSIIDLFPFGIINIHPSLLPLYRGPSPIETAIMNGDDTTGVSIMQLSAKMDAGPVYHQAEYHMQGDETKFMLYDKLASISASELIATLPRIFDGSLSPQPQDESRVSYCQLLTKVDSLLDPTKLTAAEAERRVRAFLGFPRTKLLVNDREIIVTKAHVSADATTLSVKFIDGNYLVVDELIAPSGKTMQADDYLRGYS